MPLGKGQQNVANYPEFKGRNALITGGTKGLGLEVARLLAENGCNVFLSYRSDEESATAARNEIIKFGVRCECASIDLSEESATEKLFAKYSATFQTLDLYIHNAAATAFKPLLDLKAHHIDKTMNISVKSLIIGAQHARALMIKNDCLAHGKSIATGSDLPNASLSARSCRGSIVTISGMDTLRAVPSHGLLGAAKAALETLTKYLAHEFANDQIYVNSVNPGFFRTESTEKYLGPMFDKVAKGFARQTAFKREPELREIAEAILFLSSSRASWITGQTIYADGGFNFSLPMG